MQVYHVLEASIGNSLEINKLVETYDDTVVTDFLNEHGASLSPLLGQLRWVLLIYVLFSVFINAGLLYAVVKNKKGWKTFWEGGAAYFFRFFKVAVFFSHFSTYMDWCIMGSAYVILSKFSGGIVFRKKYPFIYYARPLFCILLG